MMNQKKNLIQACDNESTVMQTESELPENRLRLAERNSERKASTMMQATKIGLWFLQWQVWESLTNMPKKKMVFRGPKKDIEILNDDKWFENLGWSGWVLVSNVSCTSIENDNLPIDEIDVEVEWAVNEM